MKIRKVNFRGKEHYVFKVGLTWLLGPEVMTGAWLIGSPKDFKELPKGFNICAYDYLEELTNWVTDNITGGSKINYIYQNRYKAIHSIFNTMYNVLGFTRKALHYTSEGGKDIFLKILSTTIKGSLTQKVTTFYQLNKTYANETTYSNLDEITDCVPLISCMPGSGFKELNKAEKQQLKKTGLNVNISTEIKALTEDFLMDYYGAEDDIDSEINQRIKSVTKIICNERIVRPETIDQFCYVTVKYPKLLDGHAERIGNKLLFKYLNGSFIDITDDLFSRMYYSLPSSSDNMEAFTKEAVSVILNYN